MADLERIALGLETASQAWGMDAHAQCRHFAGELRAVAPQLEALNTIRDLVHAQDSDSLEFVVERVREAVDVLDRAPRLEAAERVREALQGTRGRLEQLAEEHERRAARTTGAVQTEHETIAFNLRAALAAADEATEQGATPRRSQAYDQEEATAGPSVGSPPSSSGAADEAAEQDGRVAQREAAKAEDARPERAPQSAVEVAADENTEGAGSSPAPASTTRPLMPAFCATPGCYGPAGADLDSLGGRVCGRCAEVFAAADEAGEDAPTAKQSREMHSWGGERGEP